MSKKQRKTSYESFDAFEKFAIDMRRLYEGFILLEDIYSEMDPSKCQINLSKEVCDKVHEFFQVDQED